MKIILEKMYEMYEFITLIIFSFIIFVILYPLAVINSFIPVSKRNSKRNSFAMNLLMREGCFIANIGLLMCLSAFLLKRLI